MERYDFFCECCPSSSKLFGVLCMNRLTFLLCPFVLWSFCLQHFRENLDKLYAKGIGMLDIALTEAFELLNNVSKSDTHMYTNISAEIYYPYKRCLIKQECVHDIDICTYCVTET